MSNRSKTYIKELNIKRFRALADLNITFSEKINIICGQNGTSKSTILGFLGQICNFENEYDEAKTELNYKTIGGKLFKSQFSEHFRFSKVFDRPTPKKSKKKLEERTEEIWNATVKVHDGYTDKLMDNLRIDFTRRRNSLRLVLRGNNDRNITHPVIFLGLKRLFPISERTRYSPVTFDYFKDNNNQKIFIDKSRKILLKEHLTNAYTKVSSTNAKIIPSSVAHGDNYDQDSVSVGEDNIGQILQALESFKKLSQEYKNYKGGLLLIDEADAALFPAAQKKLMDILKEYSESYNIQIVMTSHSLTMISYLDKLGSQVGKIIPLYYEKGKIITGDKSIKEIESDLLVQQISEESRKIRCYFEDNEAIELFKSILKYKNQGTRLLSRKLELMNNVSLGASNYIELVNRNVPEFKDLSLIILDGDTNVSKAPSIIKLPFNEPPDQVLFEFLFLLPNDDDFWTKIGSEKQVTKQVFLNDIADPVIKYFDFEANMTLEEIKGKINQKKGTGRDKTEEIKAREVFKTFYKTNFIQDSLEDDEKNPFIELIKRNFDIKDNNLQDFINTVEDQANKKLNMLYQNQL